MQNVHTGLQAILHDALLMDVAAARPSSSSGLMKRAKQSLKKLSRDSSEQNEYYSLPRHVPPCLCKQAEEVREQQSMFSCQRLLGLDCPGRQWT